MHERGYGAWNWMKAVTVLLCASTIGPIGFLLCSSAISSLSRARLTRYDRVYDSLTPEHYSLLPEFLQNENYSTFAGLYPERMPYALGLSSEKRDEFIYPAISTSSALDILMRDTVVLDKHIFKTKDVYLKFGFSLMNMLNISGPWNINTSHYSYKAMKSLSDNQNLYPLLETIALENLSADKLGLILHIPKMSNNGVAGYVNGWEEIVVFGMDGNIDKYGGVLAHELSHRLQSICNLFHEGRKFSRDPYRLSLKSKSDFESIMRKTYRNMTRSYSKGRRERYMYKSFEATFAAGNYNERDYHAETIAKPHEFIGYAGGELPPHIREDIQPLERYYKQYTTPRSLEYIESNKHRDMLLPSDMDKYHPETILYSRQDFLDYKARKDTLTPEEKALLEGIKTINTNIESNNVSMVMHDLNALDDEWARREVLSAAIAHNRGELFDDILGSIEGKKYLGPQLLLTLVGREALREDDAEERSKGEMARKILPYISNQYYLAKAAEIAVKREDEELLREITDKISDPWFLVTSIEKAEGTKVEQFLQVWKPHLQQAIEQGDVESVRSWMLKGANANGMGKDDIPLLAYAVKAGHLDVVKVLMEYGADVDVVKVLMEYGADVKTSVEWAVEERKFDVVNFLRSSGVNVNDEYDNCLGGAIIHGNSDFFEELLSNGANVNGKYVGESHIKKAIIYKRFDMAKILIERGADVNEDGQDILYIAVAREHIDSVKFLIENGADVNMGNSYGKPLERAITMAEDLEMVRLLIENGADVNVKRWDGMVPLEYTIQTSIDETVKLQIVKLLIENGADKNVRNRSGQTALESANSEEMRKIIRETTKLRRPRTFVERVGRSDDPSHSKSFVMR